MQLLRSYILPERWVERNGSSSDYMFAQSQAPTNAKLYASLTPQTLLVKVDVLQKIRCHDYPGNFAFIDCCTAAESEKKRNKMVDPSSPLPASDVTHFARGALHKGLISILAVTSKKLIHDHNQSKTYIICNLAHSCSVADLSRSKS